MGMLLRRYHKTEEVPDTESENPVGLEPLVPDTEPEVPDAEQKKPKGK